MVPFGKLRVGALNLRIIKAGLGDRAFGVVDDELGGDSVEPLEGPAVTGQPGLHLLIGDNLGIHMPAEAKGHYKNPGLDHFSAKDVNYGGPFSEIHLSGASGGKIEDAGDLGILAFANFLHEAANRRVAAGEGKLLDQRSVDGGSPNAFPYPLLD